MHDLTLLSRIEEAGLNASAPPQQLWMDGWLVRLSPGKAKRARCINAVAPGRLPVADKLARAKPLFQAAGLPLVVRLTPFSEPGGLDEALAQHGLLAFDDTAVMVADLADIPPQEPLPAGLHLVPSGPDDYARIVGSLRGSPVDQQLAHAQRLTLSPVPYQGWLLRRDDEVLACGQFAREAECVGLYDVYTAPQARNLGLSRALCSALLQRAASQGARIAYLQVDGDNAPARAVYHRLGFSDGYRYHYRSAEPLLA
jgi:GNAT superfamily N-acetyltransferase